ncbi:isochorismate synthase [Pseudanabaena mucicola]|uniref:isochorismate synthase n=1 Tax=Pseudanabaena mucicola FACHB-723 TaxID=2692860 RepID=A0ABR7ZVE7_9CYAN|nr:isochorismate synthase [Pseudanabaena mucicola]MBD2187893.1 isochorismate synthase [Pseudanabaena mucicola FACHB-723]
MQVRQSVTYSSIDSKSLHDWIVQAIAKAQIIGSPILFSYSQSWECDNPLLLLASKSEPHQPKFYWEQPNADLILAAAGSVAEVSLPHQVLIDRFDCAKKFINEHLHNAIAAQHPDLGSHKITNAAASIYVLGAFSFYGADGNCSDNLHLAEDAQPAIEFPPLLFFIPHWMVRHSSQECTLTLNHYIQPWDHADEVLEKLETMRSHLQSSSQYQAPTVHEVSKISEVQGRQIWTEIVEEALTLINQGHFEKVVLARALDVLADRDFDPFQVLHVLRCEYPECISFLLDYGTGKTFLGATPEVVLQFESQGEHLWLRSDALAGSIRRGKTVQEDQMLGEHLLNSEKDMREHQIVIRSICDRLQSMGAAIDPQVTTGLLKLSNVQHLHTPITAQINDPDWLIALNILQQLHPTAAVGGEPRDRAVCFMQQWEACDRGWYAAPIGWLNGNGEGTFGVGIRAGYIQGDRARIFAGAGIVADSQVENEQSETTIKFAALLKALGAI